MATQRYISTSFWDDNWIQTLDPSEKLLYLYLMTGPLTNIAGVYKITVRRIVFDTGFNQDTITHIFDKFEKNYKAHRVGEYVVIPSWPQHQKWEKAPKIREGIISVLQDLPNGMIDVLIGLNYRFDLSAVSNTIISSKLRKDISGTTTKSVYEKYNNQCSRCFSSENLNIHHIKPIKNGGGNDLQNLEILCVECHKKEHSPDTLSGLECQSRYPSSYLDLDLDLHSDRDIDININSNKEEKILFSLFRGRYPGTKRGDQIEFQNFKKHKDWKNCISLLLPSLENEIAHKSKLKELGKFCPEWKNLSTWINQRCWESEFSIIETSKPQIKNGAQSFGDRVFDELQEGYKELGGIL